MPHDHTPTPTPEGAPAGTPTGTPTVHVQVEIPDTEWTRLHIMANHCDDDERVPLGCLRLRTIGGTRCWDASDGVLAVRYCAGSDSGDYDLLVPPSVIRFGDLAVDHTGSATIKVLEYPNGELRIELTGPGGSMSVPSLHTVDVAYPDLDMLLLSPEQLASGSEVARAMIRQEVLVDLARNSRMLRHPLPDDAPQPVYALTLHHDHLDVEVDWFEAGISRYRVPVEGSGGPVRRRVSASRLELAGYMLPNDEYVELILPNISGQPVQLMGDDGYVLLQPVSDPNDLSVLRPKVEQIINEALMSVDATADPDGDYALSRKGVLVRGRIISDNPALLRVSAVIIDGIDTSPDLLRELNDLNSSLGLARLSHARNQVRAEIDLLIASLDTGSLLAAIDRVREVVTQVTPVLAVVFGGSTADDPHARRWEHYRTTVVEAEVSPGNSVCLNGPDAVAEWPFPGPVYVITGWNPQGVALSEERHYSVNSQIARDIVALRGRFVQGEGRSPDGTHREPSLVAWGIPRETALRMGFRAQQDAIIEIDEHEFRLLSCADDHEESWPRIG